ncbi:MAG TPA: PfkB family carbohydrate kinase [Vicinamibacterales bacterium]|nr:PfkB family carbohydrate kinase [Vicinamibacterales bacterium]
MPASIAGPAWDVLGVGANSVDFVNLLPGYPRQHGTLAKMRIRRQEICCGGQMATALSTCASLGLRTKYIGVSGTDENGKRVRHALAEREVDMTDAVIRDATNQFAIILVEESTGERIVLWDRDERLNLRPRELPLELVGAVRLVHVDDVDQDAAIRVAKAARAAGVPVTSDLDRLTDRTEEVFAAVTIPILAEHVPPALTGHDDQESALRKLRARHDGLLVVTLGSGGAVALDHDRFLHVPAFTVPVVDTTGAGDVFRGGFIYGLLSGWPLERVLQFANAAAAVSCTRLGALNGVPALDEVTRQVGLGAGLKA